MNRVCTRLPVFSSLISHGDHQHWRMPRHGNLGQCSLSLCPWAMHCGCPELYSVEGSPQISCAARRHLPAIEQHLLWGIYVPTTHQDNFFFSANFCCFHLTKIHCSAYRRQRLFCWTCLETCFFRQFL